MPYNVNKNWRDNCKYCPAFEDCNSSKSEKECRDFLNMEAIKNLKRLLSK